MKEFIDKLISRLEEEAKLAEIDRERYLHGNANQFNYGKAVGYGNAISTAISIVNQLAEEYNNGWIPVSERLPVYLDNVLVCTKNGGRTIAHLKHTPIEWRDMYMNKIDDVIAWKYLDAPYQPKGE